MAFIVPPGGHRGFAQMTPASRAALSPKGMRSGTRRRKRKSSSKRKTSSRRKSSGRKLKFGSPQWQKKYKVGKYRK